MPPKPCSHGDKIGELEVELGAALRAEMNLERQRDEVQAQLRDAQGQVAALAAKLTSQLDHWRAALAAWKGSETIDIDFSSALALEADLTRFLDDLPVASPAIRAAAEREPGLRQALDGISAYCHERAEVGARGDWDGLADLADTALAQEGDHASTN